MIKGLLTKDAPSGIYHMGDDEALSTNELIEVICSALGKKAHIWNIPRGLMNGFAKMGDVIKGSWLMALCGSRFMVKDLLLVQDSWFMMND